MAKPRTFFEVIYNNLPRFGAMLNNRALSCNQACNTKLPNSMPTPKFIILTALTATFLFTGCKVTRQINKSAIKQESETKVDSAAVQKKDVTREENTKTVITERLDSAVTEPGFTAVVRKDTVLQDGTRVEFKGAAVKITKPTRQIPVKINKTTTITADLKEVDKTKTKTAVKKDDRKEEKQVTKTKEVTKTGISWWWIWLILVMAAAAYCVWRFYLRKL